MEPSSSSSDYVGIKKKKQQINKMLFIQIVVEVEDVISLSSFMRIDLKFIEKMLFKQKKLILFLISLEYFKA